MNILCVLMSKDTFRSNLVKIASIRRLADMWSLFLSVKINPLEVFAKSNSFHFQNGKGNFNSSTTGDFEKARNPFLMDINSFLNCENLK